MSELQDAWCHMLTTVGGCLLCVVCLRFAISLLYKEKCSGISVILFIYMYNFIIVHS